jgi:hypothetical protein
MNTIALIVTISVVSYSGHGDQAKITSPYSINGFLSMDACNKAKELEISRMQKIISESTFMLRIGKVSAECVSYLSK